jgi:Yip1 domain
MEPSDLASDFGESAPWPLPVPDDIGPAKGTKGVDLSVENPFLTIWTRPRATIRAIVDTRPEHHVLLLAAIGGVYNALGQATLRGSGDVIPTAGVLGICLILGPISGLFSLYVGGYLLRWSGSKLGGRATDQQVRAAIAWSTVPAVVLVLLWIPKLVLFRSDLFTTEMPRIAANPGLGLLMLGFAALDLILAVWSFVLLLKCLGEVHGFSAWRAIASMLLLIALLLLLVLLIMAVVFGMISLLK